ncbi:Rpr2-domain-containing protein, partial [Laetiporus sulphureus 93-53]
MAKKNKNNDQDSTPSLSGVANRDILQRLNFLYQASAYLQSISQDPTAKPIDRGRPSKLSPLQGPSKAEKKEIRRKQRHPNTAVELSREYIKSMKIIGQKTMVKMDPNVKRTMCKKCNSLLIPGTTALVRVKSSPSHGHLISYTCLSCTAARRIPAPPILDPDASPSTTGALPATTDAQPSASTSSAPTDDAPMEVDATHVPAEAIGTMRKPIVRRRRRQKHKKKTVEPRLPPLFQRKGHVVFRGNERLEET